MRKIIIINSLTPLLLLLLLISSCNQQESTNNEPKENESQTQTADGHSGETTMSGSYKANLITESEYVLSLLDLSETIPDTLKGAFGDDFHRIDLFFSQIKKESDTMYSVQGSTRLKNNLESFNGLIKVDSIMIFDEDIYGRKDSEFKLILVYSKFVFQEENGGQFAGKIILSLHQNKKDESFDFDLFDWMQDGYINYEFIGSWKKQDQKHKVYFSEGRMNIDLDGGCAEGFCPKQKYIKNGWEEYAMK